MTQEEVKKILNVGVLLSSERNLDKLLEHILSSVMELAHCDAGTLYLLEGDVLRFRIMRNDTLKTCSGGDGILPDLPPVPLAPENICARALLESRTIHVADVTASPDYDFSGSARYDAMTGYHTRSMLAVPMRNREGRKLGVLQLINALNREGGICPFQEEMALVLESVASQAAITIQNVRYIQEIQELFRSFVRAMSSAVDARSPYNGSHTRHMAACCEKFIDYLDARAQINGNGPLFLPQRREELLMGVWLHDIGKLVIPLEVMDKPARLLPEQRSAFLHRMEVIRLLGEIDELSGKRAGMAELVQATREAEALVELVDTAGFVTDERLAALEGLSRRTYRDRDGKEQPWLAPDEYAMLSIRKGTLSEEERNIMQSHAAMTDRLLSQIRFPPELSHVREWASGHHEFLDGSGYPKHLSGREIPWEVRILTILDIFDALTADDRPYKPGMPVKRALSILGDMAEKEGKLDAGLVRAFAESRCWEKAEGGKCSQPVKK